MSAVTSLTPEQKDQIPAWVAMWVAKASNLRPSDEARFEEAVHALYRLNGKPAPQRIVWVDSPFQVAAIGSTLHAMLTVDPAPDGEQTTIRDWRPHQAHIMNTMAQEWSRYIGGRWWLSYSAYTSFLREVCHVTVDAESAAKDDAFRAANEEASWWYPHSHVVIASRPPIAFHRLQVRPTGWGSHVLHCETGPSLAWADGTALYHWMGRRVPEQIIMRPETITPEQIQQESNVEVRRAMVARFGADRYVAALKVKPIHVDGEQELYRIDRPGDTPIYTVRGINGSPEPFGTEPKGDHVVRGNRWYKRYWIRVRPNPAPKTVHEAVASSYQVPASEYAWPELRT
jgi:hypothetical protein